MTQAAALSHATDTRELIVESAYACFRRHGLQKTTIVDIAKAANVSRSTIYEYFSDKGAILEACAEHASEQFYREMSEAMGQGGPLEEKLSRAAVFVTQARRVIASGRYFDEDAISLLLTKAASQPAASMMRAWNALGVPSTASTRSERARRSRSSAPGRSGMRRQSRGECG